MKIIKTIEVSSSQCSFANKYATTIGLYVPNYKTVESIHVNGKALVFPRVNKNADRIGISPTPTFHFSL